MKDNFDIKDGTATIKINQEIYPKEVIVQTTYVMLDNYYFLIDESENYFIVSMRSKKDNKDEDLEQGVLSFFDELIESQSYIDQLKRTSKIREIILERALLGQTLDDETIEGLGLNDSQKKD